MNAVSRAIQQSAEALKSHPSFVEWYSRAGAAPGDLILVNNSFVYRDLTTRKSEYYLAFRVEGEGTGGLSPYIAKGFRMNSDLKRLSGHSPDVPSLSTLDEAVREEALGADSLAFVLIAHVDDSVVLKEPLRGTAFDYIEWNPAAELPVRVRGGTITVRDTDDEDAVWDEIVAQCTATGLAAPGSLREAVGECLDRLQAQAVAILRFPSAPQAGELGMTDAIVSVLQEQRGQYEHALRECEASGEGSAHFNEVLRIAYNFSSDATMFLRLVVSICDLRPIVLWGTIGEHFALSEAFQKLPLARGERKFSLKNYVTTVADARNTAFHNLFPFRKTLSLPLPPSALQNASVRIFVEHGKRREDRLTYQDKELVNVLLEFTRARYRKAPSRFWQKNLDVMDATIALFARTSSFLKMLHAQAQCAEETQSPVHAVG